MDRWFPTIGQIRIGRASSAADYLRSVWIGFTAPILNFPISLFAVLCSLNLKMIIKFLICAVSVIFLMAPILGVAGALKSKNQPQ